MKTSEFNNFISNIINEEVKLSILNEIDELQGETYHIMCNGEPVDSFPTEDEAESHLDIYKKNHPGKQFIIEKKKYESQTDMIEKLDKMGEELEEKENIDMKKNPIKVKTLAEAILHAKNNGLKKLKLGEETIDVEESWKKLEEEEQECDECGETNEIAIDEYDENDNDDPRPKIGDSPEGSDDDAGVGFFGRLTAWEKRQENKNDFKKGVDLGKSFEKFKSTNKDEFSEEKNTCEKCGKEICECGKNVNENNTKKLRLTEKQFIKLISKMILEATSGIPQATRKAQEGSKKDNLDYAKEVEKKMKKYLSFDGNDNPEFPKQITSGDKVANKVTSKDEEFIANNRGGGLQNLDYDIEPSEKFKERMKLSINGSSLMGNAPTAEKPKITPSNDAEKGKESEDDGNVIKTDTSKKIEKQINGRMKDKKQRTLYPKETLPIKNVNESKIKFSEILGKESPKKSDKKTQ